METMHFHIAQFFRETEGPTEHFGMNLKNPLSAE